GEAGGLAGAGLRGAEKVAPGKDDGDGLRLDGGGFCVALLRDGTQQLGHKPEAFEGRTYDMSPEWIGPRRTRLRNRFRQMGRSSWKSRGQNGPRMSRGANRMMRPQLG